MKKKIMLLVATMVLVICSGAFAAPPMYAGLETGTANGMSVGFEVVPFFGISPISSLPDLAFEFNFMMDFYDGYSVVAPQVLAVYTFLDGPIRPFFGMGIGVNINSGSGGAFSWVVKGGTIIPIGSSPVDALTLVRYNVNSYEGINGGHIGVDLGLRVRF